jgi:hypothetical protein
MTFNIDEFLLERKAALLSMDEATIRSFFKKWNHYDMSDNISIFWMSVHKARTADKSLPMFERAASKHWLNQRSLESMDDGDVLPPIEKSEAAKYFNRIEEFEETNE